VGHHVAAYFGGDIVGLHMFQRKRAFDLAAAKHDTNISTVTTSYLAQELVPGNFRLIVVA
jgi:hypothetical protein